jgi:hypothetical protein
MSLRSSVPISGVRYGGIAIPSYTGAEGNGKTAWISKGSTVKTSNAVPSAKEKGTGLFQSSRQMKLIVK